MRKGGQAAERPRDEPPGQLLDNSLNPFFRSWPGRLHRVVRRTVLLVTPAGSNSLGLADAPALVGIGRCSESSRDEEIAPVALGEFDRLTEPGQTPIAQLERGEAVAFQAFFVNVLKVREIVAALGKKDVRNGLVLGRWEERADFLPC